MSKLLNNFTASELVFDFLHPDYIDYLDSLDGEIYTKFKGQIWEQVLKKEDDLIFDYIYKKIPLTQDIVEKHSYTYRGTSLSEPVLRKIHELFPTVTEKLSSDQKITEIISHGKLPVVKFLYELRKSKDENYTYPNKNITSSHINNYDVFKYMCEIHNKAINTDSKILYVNREIQQNRYKSLTPTDFIKIINSKDLEYNSDTMNRLLKKVSNIGSLMCYFSKELIEMIFTNHEATLKENLTVRMLSQLMNNACENKNPVLLKKCFDFANKFKYQLDTEDLTRTLKNLILHFRYANNEDKNETIYYLIELGIEPPKIDPYYDYYKSITLINN